MSAVSTLDGTGVAWHGGRMSYAYTGMA